jgi:hypothetical protein
LVFSGHGEATIGPPVEAHEDYLKAVEWMETHTPRNEELLRFRREAEELLAVKRAPEVR